MYLCYNDLVIKCKCGGMVDAADSKSAGSNTMWVQVPSLAPIYILKLLLIKSSFLFTRLKMVYIQYQLIHYFHL